MPSPYRITQRPRGRRNTHLARVEHDTSHQAYRKWRAAEAVYTDLLTTLGGDPDHVPKVNRQLALDLAAARAKADHAKDRFLKAALRQ